MSEAGPNPGESLYDWVNSLIIIHKPGFLAVVWTFVAISFLFIVARAYVRLRVFGRFFVDDVMVLLSWLLLLTGTILWHVRGTLDMIYISYLVGFGAETPTPYFLSHITEWLVLVWLESVLQMFSLWCIKFAFLVLFRKLSKDVRGERILWWVATALTVAALALSVGVCYYPCIFPKGDDLYEYCPTPRAKAAIYRTYHIQFGCDFGSDVLIILIPIKLLWRVKMNLRQKLGLLGLFSLVAVTMVFSIVRIVIGLRSSREDDVWFLLCGTIENSISIMIACLVSYRALYSEKHTRTGTYTKYSTYAAGSRKSFKKTSESDSFGDSYPNVYPNVVPSAIRDKIGDGRESTTYLTTCRNGSTGSTDAEAIPLDAINIQNRFEVIHSGHGRTGRGTNTMV